MVIGLRDKNGVEISEGQIIEARVKTWNGYIEIARGPVRFVSNDISSWGCGYAIIDERRGQIFLSSISRSTTEIEVVTEGKQLTLWQGEETVGRGP